uniref:Uncharacterized protein n=1 Tax=Mycena chlorophos TaxID=658473 RepID=A0ABQ0L1V2_MYCCL|nr:predicted protein [Mycena chlorophos]
MSDSSEPHFVPMDPAPPPVMLLLAHTDLHVGPIRPALLHKNLDGKVVKLALATAASASANHTYPPAPSPAVLIAAPSGLSRSLLADFEEWKEGPEVARTVNETVKSLAKEHLDTTKSFSSQKEAKLQIIYQAATKAHPLLEAYADNWPVRCLDSKDKSTSTGDDDSHSE